MTEDKKPSGAHYAGSEHGISLATHYVALWLENESGLLKRARQLIAQDERDSSALFPWWVEFLLYGAHHGKFNLNSEPAHDARVVRELKEHFNKDDFRRVDWTFVRESVTSE
ncbi:hypothetical protein [Streptomyces tubercidicus]|uniref:hypothetical protein n=1 Tax=Streptomyces tubercidicus TaxID=47759 RepID=UPI0036C54A6C